MRFTLFSLSFIFAAQIPINFKSNFKPRIAVIGGGASGTSFAYFMNKTAEITLFEKSNQFGGRAAIIKIDGINVELGAAIFLVAFQVLNK